MLARDVMQKPVAIHAEAHVKYALDKMRDNGHRFLPVVDADGRVVGLFSALSVIGHLVPDYIVSGDLDDIPYAPDFGLLRQHYDAVKGLPVSQLMIAKPFTIKQEESLLSVAAALVTHASYDAVLVEDADARLVGVITSSDVLGKLRRLRPDAADAG
ncbi:MAG: hypothetical protein AUK36_07350 [Zetaproteobacteria bacterium CG2_30_59_37]|nr:MAG: hypothetical protein AUK36_07350 [Zetaproteobacteria bacterium CG2_30_59_37]